MKRFRFAAAAAVLACALVAIPVSAGAATRAAKADKSAILQVGADITTANGGANFDPMLQSARVTDSAAAFYMPGIFDAVVRLDADGNLQPGLATKWDTTDPSVAIFTFRKGVKFQDGTDFNTAAVKAAWDRIAAMPASVAAKEVTWTLITSIEQVGTDQIKVTFSDKVALRFVTFVATTGQAAVPSPTAYDKDPEGFKYSPVGAGPYKLDSFQSGQSIELRAWKGYWQPAENQKLGGIDIIQTATGAPMVASLQAGQINLGNVSVADSAGLKGNPDIEIHSYTNSANTALLLPCATRAPFDKPEARLALSYAVDRAALNKVTFDGQGMPTDVQFSKGSPYYQKQLENKHPYSVKKAKALLAKAGVAPGTAIKVMLASTFAAEGGDKATVVLGDELKAIGLNPEFITSQSFVSDQTRINPELIVLSSDETTITNFLKTNNVVNWCKYSNPDLDAALLVTTTNGAGTPEAVAGWKTVQEILAKDSPLVYMVRAPVLYATTKNVQNFTITAAKRQPLIWGVYMTK